MRYAIVGLVVIGGCMQVQPVAVTAPTQRHVMDKSYSVGVRDTAFVGQSAIKVKDYHVSVSTSPAVEATENFTLQAHDLTCSGGPGMLMPVRGATVVNGQAHLVAAFSCAGSLGTDEVGFRIAPDGTLLPRVVNITTKFASLASVVVTPPTVRFRQVAKETINTQSGYTNYELLYGGTDGKSFTLTYREYTKDDLARPAYFQTLTFENASQSIRFRNLHVSVHEATSERLVFSVLADG